MNSHFYPSIAFLVAFFLFLYICYFFYIKYRFIELDTEETSNYFQSEFGPIYYNIVGKKGPFVLFIHGLGSSSYCWRKIIPHLESDYRLVLPDLWGFGKSSKTHLDKMDLDSQVQVLMELMDHINVTKFNVIGHSMGGHIALWLTRKFTNRVIKLIAIAPPSHPSILPAIMSKGLWLSRFTPLLINRNTVKRILNNILTNRSLIDNELIDTYYEPYKDPKAHRSFARAITLLRDQRVFNELKEVKVQMLLLYGALDRVVKKQIINEIHKNLPNCTLKISQNANHMPMEDDVDWLSQEIITFLKS
jgi:pimeloyl-ACP methyl ester carboxylesterase